MDASGAGTRRCAVCDERLSATDLFCGGCGSIAEAVAVSEPAAPADEPDAVAAGGTRPRRLRRRLAAVALTCLVLGLLSSGIAIGSWATARYARPSVPPLRLAHDAREERVPVETVVLPDVTGLAVADAENALADAGVDLRIVKTGTTPWAGPTGLVVTQQPARGAVDATAVRLTVSRRAAMPALAGKARAGAETALRALGAQVSFIPTYDAHAKLGTVLSTDPQAGATLPVTVLVRVAGEPAAVFLDALSATSGGCSSGSARLGTRDVDHSLLCNAYGTANTVGYGLNGEIDGFQATVGLVDAADATSSARVRVLADGAVLLDVRVAGTATRSVSLSVRNRRSLVLEVTTGANDSVVVAFGEARLLGAVDAIDRQSGAGP
ncbi:MAG: hypothetical protein QOE45_3012 [Frankiaceae bacterium]|jgi:hypothetical protein|nr:hypothetical protein [Frankiaceae bacterium]